MKAQGKSEAEIRKYNIDQSYADYQAAIAAENEAVKTYNENLGKVDAETFKKLQENLDKRQQASKDAYAEYLATGYNAKAEELKEEEAKNKELAGKRKAASDAKTAKRNAGILTAVGLTFLAGHWLDVYIMVSAGAMGQNANIGALEIGMALLMAGVFIFVILRNLSKAPLTPVNHPFLDESNHHEI